MILNVENDIHLFCLHYIFLPRINHAIKQFMDAWNLHPLSSCNNLSPIQLWIAGYQDVLWIKALMMLVS